MPASCGTGLRAGGFLMAADAPPLIAVRVGFAGKPGPHRAGHRPRFQISHQNRARAPAHRLRRGKRHPPTMRPVLPQCRPARLAPDTVGMPNWNCTLRGRDLLPAPSAVICYKHIRRHPGRRGKPIRGHCRWRPARTPGAVRATAIRCRSPSAMPGQPPNGEKHLKVLPLRPGCPSPWVTTRVGAAAPPRLRPACGLPVLPQQRWRHPAPRSARLAYQ